MSKANVLLILIALLLCASAPAAATTYIFTTSNATFSAGSGACLTCSGNDDDNYLDFSRSYATLDTTPNIADFGTAYVLLGSLTYNESNVTSNTGYPNYYRETDNLTPFTISFAINGYGTFTITATTFSASTSTDDATLTFSSAYTYLPLSGYPQLGARISFSNSTYDNSYDFTSLGASTNIYVQFRNAPTPEPATFGLIGAALAGLGILGYRRRKRA
jgi:hypothetical protein